MKIILFGAFIGLTRFVMFAVEDGLPAWAQYSILGLVVIALVVTKQLVPGWIYAELKAEHAEAKAANSKLVQSIIDNQAVSAPALSRSTEVIEKAMSELQKRGAK